MRRFATLAVIAVLGLAAGACGDDDPEPLDTDAVEAQVRSAFEGEDVVVEDVTCPDDRAVEEGDEFTCDVTFGDGQKGGGGGDAEKGDTRTDTVEVTQTGDGKVTFELPKGIGR